MPESTRHALDASELDVVDVDVAGEALFARESTALVDGGGRGARRAAGEGVARESRAVGADEDERVGNVRETTAEHRRLVRTPVPAGENRGSVPGVRDDTREVLRHGGLPGPAPGDVADAHHGGGDPRRAKDAEGVKLATRGGDGAVHRARGAQRRGERGGIARRVR